MRGAAARCCTFLALLVCSAASLAAPQLRALHEGWRFRLLPDDAQAAEHRQATQWHAAQVPGTVHTDLLANALIPDPYVGAAEAGLQWIGLGAWEYETRFDLDADTLAKAHAELVFEGLDTFAEVTLNGKPLLQADNSHRTWRVPVQGRLKAKDNALRVVFRSPIRTLLPKVQAMPHKIAGNYPSPYGDEPADAMVGNFVRKPGYHFGWDWGPRYVTAGIWRAVRLETWSGPRLRDIVVNTRALDANAAQLEVDLEVERDANQALQVALEILDPDGKRVHTATQTLSAPGTGEISLPVRIQSPRRWWPAGHGEQARYTVRARVAGDEGTDTLERRIGLRTVALQRESDAKGGQGFAFVVNGKPIFAKGANVIPFDAFPSRVTRERLRRDLQAARDANMNMVRNWGGGYYEDEAFFDLTDELGLMVWQDFMFGGGMQPGYDPAFRANVVAEARDNIRRLRHHPSIVLWCGNNEEETAWKDWGHGSKLEAADPAFAKTVWDGYVALFGQDLRKVVADEALGVPYWASSPSNDLDTKANDSTRGDKHYWEVWGNPALPAEAYLLQTPRFMSEYGLQAWPSLRTVDEFATPEEQRIDGPVIRAHQKFMAGEGNTRLLHYIEREYGTPRDFADFVYLSQVMQADGIELAALHHRASRPYTMGSLYWQLNDVWQGASWSSVDYRGRWKALHFHARRFFADLAVAALRSEGVTRLTLLSDRDTALPLQWRLRVMDVDGRVLREQRHEVQLAAQSAMQVAQFSDAQLLKGADPRRTLAVFELMDGQQSLARRVVYFDAAKQLQLPATSIASTIAADGEGFVLTLRSAKFARAVWIDFGALDVVPEDNAFDLLAGEQRVLRLRGSASLQDLKQALRVQSLADAGQRGTR
ncbi:beta-mannosidase [Pseudoxanthomonas composti]|uniref:Beta-mannosidase n=1 Tax=Pseudoxanthomonas composti TaxID=2137479 RepID=A0A4Q1JUP4_9GAMM|nr:glycoside hydrolase family 2 protein [Pseudoxanthomonas composti]RXR03542.1 glycoside hydrolase family 2 protein [Pseudoxanthomonas composti]